MGATLEMVIKLAEQFDAEAQDLLIEQLRAKHAARLETEAMLKAELMEDYIEPTREERIAEHEHLVAADAFENVESLPDKFASAESAVLTQEELEAQFHAIATEREEELD